ncbi:hypothetical protein B5P43_18345 [Bacillus sp. SRB_336]|nr:hypothetical protein B5P43_18345 [Bacillus sp. SRB_336]
MNEIKYPSRKENSGVPKVLSSERFDPLLIQAISEYVKWQEETMGVNTSRANIFSTAVLQHNDRIRDRYNELVRKERKDGRKYLDGIKQPYTKSPEIKLPKFKPGPKSFFKTIRTPISELKHEDFDN